MLTTQQINGLAIIVLEADIDIEKHHELDDYIGLLLENIAGCEWLSDDEFKAVVQQVLKIIKNL